MKTLKESILSSNNATLFPNKSYEKFFKYLDEFDPREVRENPYLSCFFTDYNLAEQYISFLNDFDYVGEPSDEEINIMVKTVKKLPWWEKIVDKHDRTWWVNKRMTKLARLSDKDLQKAFLEF